MARRTKIVATLGPASSPPERLDAMLRAGVDVVRLNLSHSTVDEHLARLADVRAAAVRVGRQIAVLADLPGPKVRSGIFPDGGVLLVEGTVVRLAPGLAPCTAEEISVDYPSLCDDLRPGDSVILGDGAITLRADAVGDGVVTTHVETGGRAQGRPGVHIPAERLRLKAPTPEDLRLVKIMAAAGVDFAAVSFVRSAEDIEAVRAAVGQGCPALVAKIETAPAIADIARILVASDAVMVARGDLGIECPLEDVPHLQKQIIRACVEAGVPVITATQMLESMITAPAPTRAEVSDVANAVFDGTDAVMLSAETAIGHSPELVVATMARIAERAESASNYPQWSARLGRVQRGSAESVPSSVRITQALTHAALLAATDAGCDAIICCTRSGATALAMARYRPTAALLGLSPSDATVRRMALSWGVSPVKVDEYASTDEMVWFAIEAALRSGIVRQGQLVAVLAGAPDQSGDGATDVLRLVRVK